MDSPPVSPISSELPVGADIAAVRSSSGPLPSPREIPSAVRRTASGPSDRRPLYAPIVADGLRVLVFLIAVAIGAMSGAASVQWPFASHVQWPFAQEVPISSGFGPRVQPCATCSSYHYGVDFAPDEGTPIQAIADGVVSNAGNSGGLGVMVAIDHEVDGERITSVYAHMITGSPTVQIGDPVTVGQVIGKVGNTGVSTGAHLHLELHRDGDPIDPLAWLKQKIGS